MAGTGGAAEFADFCPLFSEFRRDADAFGRVFAAGFELFAVAWALSAPAVAGLAFEVFLLLLEEFLFDEVTSPTGTGETDLLEALFEVPFLGLLEPFPEQFLEASLDAEAAKLRACLRAVTDLADLRNADWGLVLLVVPRLLFPKLFFDGVFEGVEPSPGGSDRSLPISISSAARSLSWCLSARRT